MREAGAEHYAAHHVRLVHQDQRAHSRLGVFVRDVRSLAVVSDVLEMAAAGRHDGDRFKFKSESIAKKSRVALRPRARAEARHRVDVNAALVEAALRKSFVRDEQRERRVQTA